jgi:hypothetical protein
MWSKNFDGIVSEEFYDVILEISAYAKKHLELARSYQDKSLPKNTHRAFLLAIEADNYLKSLEEHNFDIFDQSFRKRSVIKVPWAMYSAAKKGTY